MRKQWICIEECYVTVDGIWGLYAPGRTAQGEIKESSQKYFERTDSKPKPDKKEPTNKELKEKIKKLGGECGANDSKAKLKEILTALESE
ncbi:unnamed protein product [marine sediment metagenome]|uniref:Uncharacterized protein n=1 Tax=marine sediment metagenome TaxID=412755 RepID=X0XK76_9ZZZZ